MPAKMDELGAVAAREAWARIVNPEIIRRDTPPPWMFSFFSDSPYVG
jgi:hypothetical protein